MQCLSTVAVPRGRFHEHTTEEFYDSLQSVVTSDKHQELDGAPFGVFGIDRVLGRILKVGVQNLKQGVQVQWTTISDVSVGRACHVAGQFCVVAI